MFIKYDAIKRFSFLHVIVLIVVCVCTHTTKSSLSTVLALSDTSGTSLIDVLSF